MGSAYFQGFFPVVRHTDIMALFAQQERHHGSGVRVVIHDKDALWGDRLLGGERTEGRRGLLRCNR